MKLIIGTRGSPLALWQAHHVKARLLARDPDLTVDLRILKTQGDKILDVALSKVGGKGLFVKEIEEALVDGEIDLAVHSMKDVPVSLAPGLALVAISEREDPRDALVQAGRRASGSIDLPPGAHVGTSSLRRFVQLRAWRPDLRITALRGNVDTRLGKVDKGEFDVVVLAAAGLRRLGHADRASVCLDPDICLPAIGQGALGLEARQDDEQTRARVLAALNHPNTADCVRAERAFLRELGGSCQTPIAAHATLAGADLVLAGLVGAVDGQTLLRAGARGPRGEPEELGQSVARRLIEQGALALIEKAEREQAAVPWA